MRVRICEGERWPSCRVWQSRTSSAIRSSSARPAGVELLDKLAQDVRECHGRQLGHLTGSEMRTLIELLQKARAPHEPEGSDWR